MQFEFGGTSEANAFFSRNPKFYPAFERLMALANKCFGRELHPENRAEDICFDLGHTCRADYMEVLFLAVNGFGAAASKLVRGLYERDILRKPNDLSDTPQSRKRRRWIAPWRS